MQDGQIEFSQQLLEKLSTLPSIIQLIPFSDMFLELTKLYPHFSTGSWDYWNLTSSHDKAFVQAFKPTGQSTENEFILTFSSLTQIQHRRSLQLGGQHFPQSRTHAFMTWQDDGLSWETSQHRLRLQREWKSSFGHWQAARISIHSKQLSCHSKAFC